MLHVRGSIVTLNIRPDVEDVGRDGSGGGIDEEDDEVVDVEDWGGVSTPTRFDQYFRFCLKKMFNSLLCTFTHSCLGSAHL